MTKIVSLNLFNCEYGKSTMVLYLPQEGEEAKLFLKGLLRGYTGYKWDRWILFNERDVEVDDLDKAVDEMFDGKKYTLVHEYTCLLSKDKNDVPTVPKDLSDYGEDGNKK